MSARRAGLAVLAPLAVVALGAGCAPAARIAPARFANAPPVTVVDDRRHVPAPPAPRPFYRALYHFDGNLRGPAVRALDVRPARRALGVNALDQVPDSTWFENRIGVRDLGLDELRAGPARVGSPEPHRPWTIKSSKVGGVSIGFIIEDARGERFVLKFDQRAVPEVETGADVITGKLLWACGYNVPEDHVVYFRRGDLVLAPDAVIRDPFGGQRPLTARELDRQLAQVAIEPDGRIRGLASRWLDGTWLGGHPGVGVRPDDPNDRIPHERRRDLRGQHTFFAWLDHSDVKEDNSLDMWVADPADPTHRYVVHYLIDFGKSLGAQGLIGKRPYLGHTYVLDWGEMLRSLTTFGAYRRPWEGRRWQAIRGVGMFEAEHFRPDDWKPYTQSYPPFHARDRFDAFWAASILIRFTRPQLTAVVETARFSDPRAVRRIVDVLVARQRAIARHWFARVEPLLDVAVVARRADGQVELCFTDLVLAHDLEASIDAPTYYRAAAFDRAGRATGWRGAFRGRPTGRSCVGPLALAAGDDGYTIVELETRRPGHRAPGMLVHVARGPDGAPRVIGLWRR